MTTAEYQRLMEAERPAFEKWAGDYGRVFREREGDGYQYPYTQEAWVGWLARAALAAQAQEPDLRAALLQCARQAEALKRECGMDPESPQAIRNAQYQAISTTAHIALGTIRGPKAPAEPQPVQAPPEDFEQWWEREGQFYGGGQYEKTFAFRVWEARVAQPVQAAGERVSMAAIEACMAEAKFQLDHDITMDAAIHICRAVLATAQPHRARQEGDVAIEARARQGTSPRIAC